MDFPGSSAVKNLPAMQKPQEIWVWSLGQEDPLEEDMATHFSNLAWRIPRRKEPGGLQSRRSHSVRHGWSNLAHMCTHTIVILIHPSSLGTGLPLELNTLALTQSHWNPKVPYNHCAIPMVPYNHSCLVMYTLMMMWWYVNTLWKISDMS